MTGIIIPAPGRGYQFAELVGITKTGAEWRGIDDIDAYLAERTKNAEEAYRQEEEGFRKSFGLAEKVAHKLFGYFPKVMGCRDHEEWKRTTASRNDMAREELVWDETRYRLQGNGCAILSPLRLVGVEHVDAIDAIKYEDGLLNYGYHNLFQKALKVGIENKADCVEVVETGSWDAQKRTALSRRVPHTGAEARLYNRRY